ncbi:MAG: acyltransferase family protein [Caulobacteraceae bacterium]
MHGRLQPVTQAAVGHGRFTTLDGLRGVAAVVVVWFHMALRHWAPLPSFGHLAVDMFFLLSGFVLALANDPRFARGLTVRDFLIKRVVRLYPVYLIGYGLGAAALLVSLPHRLWASYPVGALIANALLLPYPASHAKIAPLFVMDGPAWSLCLEFYVANLLYAVAWRRLQGWVLALLVTASVVILVFAQHHYVNLSGGAGFETWPEGLARVMASFFGGVLLARVYRTHKPPFAAPAWLILTIMAALLFAPVTGVVSHVFELACVIIAFPALIYFGAAGNSRRPWLGAALGNASYALYVIHIPLLYFVALALRQAHVHADPAIAVLVLAGATALAYAIDRVFDAPVRAWLTRALRKPVVLKVGQIQPSRR